MKQYLDEVAAILENVSEDDLSRMFQSLVRSYHNGGTIFVCGNGGSAATASHFACDLMKWTIVEGMRRVRAIALTDNVPLITAWSNDNSYDQSFVEQLKSLSTTHFDLLFVISCSGNSPNVVRAVEWARINHIRAVALLGNHKCRLAEIVDSSSLVVYSKSINASVPQIEDAHSAICHALAVGMRDALLAQSDRAPAF